MQNQGGHPYESGHPIDGVSCAVKTCSYNHSGNRCTANRIQVANDHSDRATDTFCGTFSKR